MATADKLDYLLETKKQIKEAIIEKGVSVEDTDSFRSYASKIGQIEANREITNGWQPETDWWDIETILKNDTENYPAKVICLLTNQLDDKATINIAKGGTKYKLSDGQVIEHSASTDLDITSLFDVSKDKKCSKGYKTRYIIYYSNSNMDITLPNNAIYTIFSGVTFSQSPFKEKRFLQGIEFLDNTNCTNENMSYMFTNCYNLKHISKINTNSVTNMQNMFQNCRGLQKAPEMNTSSVTNMSGIFYGCYSLQQIPEIDTSNVTNMSSMFNGCCSLQQIPEIDTSNVTNMSNMFYRCSSLQQIPKINTNNVTNMSSMFSNSSIEQIPEIDTSNVTNMSNMFYICPSLQQVLKIDVNNATNIKTIFQSCSSLFNVDIRNIRKDLNVSISTYLTHISLLKILNSLIDLTGQALQTLTLGSTNLAKLTEEEIAVATEKNWTLS